MSRTRIAARLLVGALAVALAVAGSGCKGGFDPETDAAAVVLVKDGQKSALVVVDLERFEVVRRVRLRSQSFSIDAEPSARVVATAQCGGLDRETDDACGIYRLGERRPDYVRLPVPNPYDVAVSGGCAYLTHGFVDERGLCTSVVDLATGRVVHSGRIAIETQQPERVSGRVLAPQMAMPPDAGEQARDGRVVMLGRSQETTLVDGLRFKGGVFVRNDAGGDALLFAQDCGPDTQPTGRWSVYSIDATSGAARKAADASWFAKGPEVPGCLTADGITLADSSATDPADTGHDVLSLDSGTFKPVLRRTLKGMPAAVAAWREKTLVVDGKTGELFLFDKGAKRPDKRLSVSRVGNLMADIVVFDAREGGDSVDKPR
jgi:hypothetical protein